MASLVRPQRSTSRATSIGRPTPSCTTTRRASLRWASSARPTRPRPSSTTSSETVSACHAVPCRTCHTQPVMARGL
eukprot:3078160-Prymnesium_polylepis.1